MKNSSTDTIVALATPPGFGGVHVVRVSGPKVPEIIKTVVKKQLQPRQAEVSYFYCHNEKIDQGLAIYFQTPRSFTGEHVLELQGHGGMVVANQIIHAVLDAGARLANPGEFSERAFLNNKLDLTQAEAIADLIHAQSEQAAQAAMRSLQGEFSKTINQCLDALIQLRKMVEVAIDFSEEDIKTLRATELLKQANNLLSTLDEIIIKAKEGAKLRQGFHVVVAGPPNAGKSSLMNALCAKDTAIVTNQAGTTRDVLRETVYLEGLAIELVDTAGLHSSEHIVEQEGIRRAQQEIRQADCVLWIEDVTQPKTHCEVRQTSLAGINQDKIIQVYNKIDLLENNKKDKKSLYLSAETQEGLDELKSELKKRSGIGGNENTVIARERHVDALLRCQSYCQQGVDQFKISHALELFAEDLRLAQQCLSEITGAYYSDDLLGEIFSSFCIGK